MIPEQDYKMYLAMRHYGGSFVQALAEAMDRADAENYQKLKAAFPEYCAQYTEMGNRNENKV